MAPDGIPIAFTALTKGVPVVSASGHRFGTVDQVLEVPSEDIFHGLVVDTPAGLRFVDRDHVEAMTTTEVICALSEDQVAALPAASAPSRGGDRPGGPAGALPGTSWIRTSWFGPSWSRPRLRFGPVVIVRCARGALFTTLWIPLVSVKAVRLGSARIQRCPVHRRWEVVRQVDPGTLSAAERAQAARYPAGPLP